MDGFPHIASPDQKRILFYKILSRMFIFKLGLVKFSRAPQDCTSNDRAPVRKKMYYKIDNKGEVWRGREFDSQEVGLREKTPKIAYEKKGM